MSLQFGELSLGHGQNQIFIERLHFNFFRL